MNELSKTLDPTVLPQATSPAMQADNHTRLWLRTARVSLIGLALLFAFFDLFQFHVPTPIQAGLYLAGMVALNLPHGGFEHFSNLTRRSLAFSIRYVVGFLFFIALFIALFFISPTAGLSLAILMAILKGGGGDLKVMDAATGSRHLKNKAQRLLAIIARGAPVMLIPMVAHQADFQMFAQMMINMFSDTATSGASVAALMTQLSPLIIAAVAGILTLHLGLGLYQALNHRNRADALADWARDGLDTLILAVFFTCVPVLVAVGMYFPFWYSARQVARSLSVKQDIEPEPGAFLVMLEHMQPVRMALYTWLILMIGALITAVIAGAILLLMPNPFIHQNWLYNGVGFWTIFISIIALPHVVVGDFLDKKRGIWYAPNPHSS